MTGSGLNRENPGLQYLLFYLNGLFVMNVDRVHTTGSGQREPPRLVLEEGGTSTLQAAMPGKLKSPPHFKVPRIKILCVGYSFL